MKFFAVFPSLVFSLITSLIAGQGLAVTLALEHAQANRDRIVLSNGDILEGTILEQEDTTITFQHPVLGILTLETGQFSMAQAPAHETTQVASASLAATTQPIAAPASDEDATSGKAWLPRDWEKQVDLGISGADGNSQSRDIHLSLYARHDNPEHRWDFQSVYDQSEKDGEKSQDEFYAALNRDWLLPDSPYFYFTLGRFDWDDFQDWDYRLNLAGGIGKDFIKRNDWLLSGKSGLGFNREFGGDDDGISPEGLLELLSHWTLTEHHKIELKTTFYPQLDELSEFRNITSLSWVNKLNASMRLKVGLSNEHDSDVPEGVKRNHLKYMTSLGWDF